MTRQEGEERNKTLTLLAEILNHKLSPAAIGLFIRATEDIGQAEFRAGCNRAANEARFFPKPSELRAFCGCSAVASLTAADRSVVAWAAIKASVATHGGYATVEFDDPLVTAAVRSLGGWPRICDTEAGESFDVWLRKDFERTYAALMATGITGEQAAPLAGLCDISNSATGHDSRLAARMIQTGLPCVPNRLVRGPRHAARLPVSGVVAESVKHIGVICDDAPQPRHDPVSADEQRRLLGEWQLQRGVR